jgi:hypothetical protein
VVFLTRVFATAFLATTFFAFFAFAGVAFFPFVVFLALAGAFFTDFELDFLFFAMLHAPFSKRCAKLCAQARKQKILPN